MIVLGAAYGCATEGGKGLEERLLETNREISQKIDDVAKDIDLYVANRKYVDEPNRSRVVIYNGFHLSEGGERRYAPQVGVKLHLPNLQQKLQLRFTTYDEDAEDRGINENRYQSMERETTYGTSLALFQQLGDVKTEFRPRLEMRDKLETSYLFSFSSEASRGAFAMEPELQLFARSDTGTGQFVAFNLGFELAKDDQLTLINEEQYTDGDNTLTTNHGVRWEHDYNDLMQQDSAVVVESNNRETYHLEQTVVRSTFKHQLRKNVLHYGLTPFLTFGRVTSFHPVASLDLRIEIIF